MLDVFVVVVVYILFSLSLLYQLVEITQKRGNKVSKTSFVLVGLFWPIIVVALLLSILVAGSKSAVKHLFKHFRNGVQWKSQ